MSDDEKMQMPEPTKMQMPEARGRVSVRRVKDRTPLPAASIPEEVRPDIEGDTAKIGVRFDQEQLDLIQEHIDRLADMTPTVITASDAIRSLVRAGTLYFRNQRNEDTDD